MEKQADGSRENLASRPSDVAQHAGAGNSQRSFFPTVSSRRASTGLVQHDHSSQHADVYEHPLIRLQRLVGNRVVSGLLQRDPSPTTAGVSAGATRPMPSLFDAMAAYFRSLPRPVQDILMRYSVFEVERHPDGHWTMRRTREQPSMDLTGGPELLFKLHQQRAYADYLILLEQLLVPQLTRRVPPAAVEPQISGNDLFYVKQPAQNLPTASLAPERQVTDPLMWVRNPPPGLRQNPAFARRLDAARTQVEGVLGQIVTRTRQAAVTNEGPRNRPSYAFILGQDARHSGNQFYTLATQYMRAQPNVTVVTDLRSLDAVLAFIRRLAPDQPIGTIYLVSHAHRSGRLSFNLTGQSQHAGFGGAELADAIRENHIDPLSTPAVDARTRIVIKGCDAGQDAGILNQLRTAFGGQATVLAPRHKQVYIGNSRHVTEGQAFGYWIEFPAVPGLSAQQRRARLQAKYPEVPPENWPRWMADTRWSSLVRNSFEWTITYRDPAAVPKTNADRAAAVRQQFAEFDDYSWVFAVHSVGSEFHLIATGTNLTYTLDRRILDQDRALHQYELSDPSGFGIDQRPLPDAAATSVPWTSRP